MKSKRFVYISGQRGIWFRTTEVRSASKVLRMNVLGGRGIELLASRIKNRRRRCSSSVLSVVAPFKVILDHTRREAGVLWRLQFEPDRLVRRNRTAARPCRLTHYEPRYVHYASRGSCCSIRPLSPEYAPHSSHHDCAIVARVYTFFWPERFPKDRVP